MDTPYRYVVLLPILLIACCGYKLLRLVTTQVYYVHNAPVVEW